MSKEKLLLYPHKIKWLERIPVAQKANSEVVPLQTEEPLKLECQHRIGCIEKRVIPKTEVREGVETLRVLQASQKSLGKGEKIYMKEVNLKIPTFIKQV